MNYLVLRNCYTEEQRYFSKGDVVDLPDEMFKYEKNFALIGEVEEKLVTKEPATLKELQEKKPDTLLAHELNQPVVVKVEVPSTPETSPEPRPGEYLCSKCNGMHRANSRLGARHMKYKQ